MTALSSHHSAEFTKMLVIGDSGGGKTGALASLAKAGYRLHIIDCDNGLDILANVLKSDPKALANVDFVTVTEPMKAIGGLARIIKAEAYSKAAGLLSKWDDGSDPANWGPKDILVIDSLTFFCRYAMNAVLALNGRLNSTPWQSDWGQAQALVSSVLQLLYSNGFKTNVIVNCHITYIGREVQKTNDKGEVETMQEDVRGYPMSLGKALSPQIGTFFNHALMTRTMGSGPAAKRQLLTNTQGLIELKTAAPGKVKGSYPIETGLADYFRDIRA